MVQVKSIDLVFENCEDVNIPKEFIGDFKLKDITSSISRQGCNSIGKDIKAGFMAIQIKKDANDLKTEIWGMEFPDQIKLFDRIKHHHDITWIHINYENGESEAYYLDWNEDDEYSNVYQSEHIDKEGHFYILVTKENIKIEEYFAEAISICEGEWWWI